MQVWYIIFGIAVLLFITTVINNIAEAIERREREKKIKILKLQRENGTISDYIQSLITFDLPKEIITLLDSEKLSRYEKIKQIDSKYEDISELIAQAKERLKENTTETDIEEEPDEQFISEDNLVNKLNELRRLTTFIHESNLLSPFARTSQLNYEEILVNFRFEKLNRFYSKEAQKALKNNNFELAKTYIEKISTGITMSGYYNPRLSEIREQAMLVLVEIKLQKEQYQAELDEQKRVEEEALAKEEKEKNKKKKKKPAKE